MALGRAAALGYTVNTFHTGLWNPTKATDFPRVRRQRGADAGPWNAAQAIDWQNTGALGFQWYVNQPFGGKPTPADRLTVNRDGSLTIRQGTINSFSASTGARHGICRRPYFEATLSFDAKVTAAKEKAWPAWWAMSLEHFLNLPGEHWVDSPPMSSISRRWISSNPTPAWAGPNTFGGATHDWGGVWGKDTNWQYDFQNSNFVIHLSPNIDFSLPHRYGYLWLPATPTSAGYAHYYFDGLPTADKITWSYYNPDNPPSPPAERACGSSASTIASMWH